MKQGWECPKCNTVYAPWIAVCPKCKNTSIGYEYTVGSKTDEVSGTWCLNKESEKE